MTIKRQALVTGANKGIGLAIAKGLAEAGFFVWIGARDQSRGEQAVAQLRNAGLDAGLLELDVAVEASVHLAAATLSAQIGALDVLVNNARYPVKFECRYESRLRGQSVWPRARQLAG